MSNNKRRGGYLATAEGVIRLKEAKRVKKYTYPQIAELAQETENKVKRLFNPQWGNGQYKIGEEAVQAICNVLEVKPEDIVRDWYIQKFKPEYRDLVFQQIPDTMQDEHYSQALEKIKSAIKNNTKKLDFSGVQLMRLPREVKQLTQLTHISLSSTLLGTLPTEIFQLTNLISLDQRYAFLRNLPREIGQLTQLIRLDLRNNLLTNLPSEIGQLIKLKGLGVSNNYLSTLPAEIGQLTNLTHLYLSNNSLSKLPAEIGQLTNLTHLYLSNNSLSKLPAEIGQLTNLTHLYLSNNPLEIPPEIINRYYDPQSIIGYYISRSKSKKQPIHEAKMLLVGQGNVGKTCIRERILRDQYDPVRNKTNGIDIEPWKIQVEDKELQVNIWDFGGQEIMHSTHQFFLTKRSLYVLVLDTTIGEEENRIEYWLKIIQSFGKDAPVVVVGNKADQHPLDIDKTGLKNKYPQIKEFFEISCETGQGISELADYVKQEINQLDHIDDLLPLPWFNVKEKLEELDKDYIPYDKYEEICEAEGIVEADKQRILIRLLNDLGIVLNFQDDPRLEDTHVLNPEWVTNGVYKILNDRKIIVDDRGILKISELNRILNQQRYPIRKHLFITGMMRKFELCFDLEPDKQFLISDILPKEERYTGEWEKTLAFEYHYPVLPGSVISRFIVRMNHYIHKHTYWRNGVVLEHEGNLALVKADREDKIIKIRVKGKANTRRNLLTAIRSQFDYIHKTIPGIVPVEKVPLIDHPEIILDYQELLGLEAMGETSYPIGKLRQRIPLTELLNGISSKSDRTIN